MFAGMRFIDKVMGRSKVLKMIRSMFLRNQIDNTEHLEIMVPYMYQIFARQSSTENAMAVSFNFILCCHTPLADKLRASDLNISFIYGEKDWVWLMIDKGASKSFDHTVIPGATHNLHYS